MKQQTSSLQNKDTSSDIYIPYSSCKAYSQSRSFRVSAAAVAPCFVQEEQSNTQTGALHRPSGAGQPDYRSQNNMSAAAPGPLPPLGPAPPALVPGTPPVVITKEKIQQVPPLLPSPSICGP